MIDFPVPYGVQTAVTYPELRLLQQYAHEAGDVLEIGTQFGFTCIGMALAGARVDSVDPHFEGPQPNQPDTWEAFIVNCERHGFRTDGPHPSSAFLYTVDTHILAFREAIEDFDMLGRADPPFGLVFIDGNHIWPQPQLNLRIALQHLRAPGYVAFHDVTPHWPGVWRTVRETTQSGELVELARVQTMGVYQARDYQK